jgi:hypothetical protein
MDGIEVNRSGTDQNRITKNSIHDNADKGIFLAMGNHSTAAPVIEGLSPVTGSSAPGSEVEIFSGNDDEGLRYLSTVTADVSGQFSWAGEVTDRFVTATATDAAGNTSEFSLPYSVTDAVARSSEKPQRFYLFPNFPNPFNPETMIRYSVKDPCRVVLKVFDTRGIETAILKDGPAAPGEHTVRFNAAGLPSGIYMARITMKAYSATRKMVVME